MRSALLALACMEPMAQLLAARSLLEVPGLPAEGARNSRKPRCQRLGSSLPPSLPPSLPLTSCPLQIFRQLEMPSHLALLHINASAAAPRLSAPRLAAALVAARGSASLAQEHLRRLYGMPGLELGCEETVLQLLGALLLRCAALRSSACTCRQLPSGARPTSLTPLRPTCHTLPAQARSKWGCQSLVSGGGPPPRPWITCTGCCVAAARTSSGSATFCRASSRCAVVALDSGHGLPHIACASCLTLS